MKANSIIILLFLTFLAGCQSKEEVFPISKRYWTPDDYRDVTQTLRFGYQPDEELPNFNNPETKIVVEKFTDPQNYKVLLDDKELGLKFKSKTAEDFFSVWQDMIKVYQARDVKDNYIYEKELLKTFQFGLGLQLRYFTLGNKVLMQESANEEEVKNTVQSNIQSLVNNFGLYLDLINDENSFSDQGKKLLSDGIVKYFSMLVNQYPDADYSSLKYKMEALKKKSKSDVIKNSLQKIIDLINSKKSNS